MQIKYSPQELKFAFNDGVLVLEHRLLGRIDMVLYQGNEKRRLGRQYLWGRDEEARAKVDERLAYYIKVAKNRLANLADGSLGPGADHGVLGLADELAYAADLGWRDDEWRLGLRRMRRAKRKVKEAERKAAAASSEKAEHGIYSLSGICVHKKGCFPRAVSRAFGKHLGMNYDEIVEAAMKSKAAVGQERAHRLDFDSSGMGMRAIEHFAKAHGLRQMRLEEPMQMKKAAKRWPDSVLGVSGHAIPFVGGEQKPNPGLYKRGRIWDVVVPA